MKTKKTGAGFFLIATISSVFIISCKKDSDTKPTCRIITMTETTSSGSTIYNITYNNDGKISTLNRSGSSVTNKVFNYSGNTIIITSTDGSGTFSGRDSITIDGRGKPLNIRQFSDQAGTSWSNFSFEYNGDDLLKFHQTSNSSSTPITNVATYSNGNMTSLQSTSSVATLEYFTDKNVQPGDYLEISSLVQYGVTIYPHKKLLKTISSGSSITNFNYEMNPDGMISKVTATSASSVSTLTYQYQCN